MVAGMKRNGVVRRGFTLIELLMVITIIGMLMGLTSVYVWRAIQRAKETKISVEVDQLSQAMFAYKEQRIQYPPSLGNVDLDARKIAFMRHLQAAFTNLAYGTTPKAFNNLTLTVKAPLSATSPVGWGYNYQTNDGSVFPLDLNTLDQAEALVFWLGGFPTPYDNGVAIAGRKLFGFHRDTDNPFRRDVAAITGTSPLNFRTDMLYSFDQTRLVDNDQDGWLEYVAAPPKTGESAAPYVYFDGDCYGKSSTGSAAGMQHLPYPRPDGSNVAQLYNLWGTAVPFALYVDNNGQNPTKWANPDGFQIISAGLDGAYTDPGDAGGYMRVPIFPTGIVYKQTSSFRDIDAYTRFELDNLTNLSNKTLEGARSESQQ